MNLIEINKLEIEIVPTGSIFPYARNPRNNAHAVDKVAASIVEFGFKQPIVVDGEGIIVVGHTRHLAAQKIGLKEVPVIRALDLTPVQAKAYRIADNRVADEATWDEDLLGLELSDLQGFGFDLAVTGFDAEELIEYLPMDDPAMDEDQADDAPAVQDVAISTMGTVWCLGPHRLICGDSTDQATYDALLGDERPHLVWQDPPYNVDYANSAKDKLDGKDRPILNDNLGHGFHDFLLAALTPALARCDGAVYIAMSSSELATLQSAFRAAGGHWSTFIIWAKNTFTLGRADYQRQYEPILYGWREGGSHHWCGDRDQGDVWQIKKPAKNDLHPTMKPVELVERCITNSSRPGNLVLDSFGGSGTTLIACERTKRVARLIELDPRYCDVIVRRWQDWTGKSAYRLSDNLAFSDLEGE